LLPGWLPKVLALAVVLLLLLALCWYKLVKPQIAAAAQNQVTKALKPINKELQKLGTPVTTSPPPVTTTPTGSTTTTTRPPVTTSTTTATTTPRHKVVPPKRPAVFSTPINASLTATGNNSTAAYTVPSGKTLEVTDILLQNSAGASGDIYLENDGTVLMSWALANFRDLDYHWITPMYFNAKSQLQLAVRGCNSDCVPALYFAGDMTSAR
jgi:cytoskeletal protein RodZ